MPKSVVPIQAISEMTMWSVVARTGRMGRKNGRMREMRRRWVRGILKDFLV